MVDNNLDKSLKQVNEEYIHEDNLYFFADAFSFPVEAMDKILFELGKAGENGHSLPLDDLKNRVYPPKTTGQILNIYFNTALKILDAWNFIEIVNNVNILLSVKGFKLFEILNTQEEIEKPYSAFLTRKQRIRTNEDELLKYQILVAKQQSELNPIIKESNRTSEKIQSSLLSINRWLLMANGLIAFGTIVAAIYYAQEMNLTFERWCFFWFFLGSLVGVGTLLLFHWWRRLSQNKSA